MKLALGAVVVCPFKQLNLVPFQGICNYNLKLNLSENIYNYLQPISAQYKRWQYKHFD